MYGLFICISLYVFIIISTVCWVPISGYSYIQKSMKSLYENSIGNNSIYSKKHPVTAYTIKLIIPVTSTTTGDWILLALIQAAIIFSFSLNKLFVYWYWPYEKISLYYIVLTSFEGNFKILSTTSVAAHIRQPIINIMLHIVGDLIECYFSSFFGFVFFGWRRINRS